MVLRIVVQKTVDFTDHVVELTQTLLSLADTIQETYYDNTDYDADEEVVELAGAAVRYSRLAATALQAFAQLAQQLDDIENEGAEEADLEDRISDLVGRLRALGLDHADGSELDEDDEDDFTLDEPDDATEE